LTGAGDKAFCAGGDVKSFHHNQETIDHLLMAITTPLHLAISRFAWGHAPVIAAVNGVAAGGGLSLVAAADYVIAVDSARFTSAYTTIGYTPDGSSTFFMPRLIGLRRATELYLTNRVLSADEALNWGLINRVVTRDKFDTEVKDLATTMARGPTRAYREAKAMFHLSMNDTLESQMEREGRTVIEMAMCADGREGIKAFVEKRKPVFHGFGK
jgi:2-(1,2-epoxy-1,2-dihydrophenyl)acetyl-CoA isomerase